MLVRKAECLTYMGLLGNISQDDEALLDLLHPLAEAALQSWMQAELQYQQHVEYYPIGQPQLAGIEEYQLDDVDFRSSNVVFRNTRSGGPALQLKHTPVVTFGLEVREDPNSNGGQADDAFGDDSLLSLGSDYWLDIDEEISVAAIHAGTSFLSRTGILYRVSAWPLEPRSVKVTYYAGWTAEQFAGRSAGAVKLAALKTVANAYWGAKANHGASAGRGPATSESIGKYSVSYGANGIANLQITVPDSAKQDLWPFRNLGRTF
jgi:hypothetical protein